MFWPPSLDQLNLFSSLTAVKFGLLPTIFSWLIGRGWNWVIFWDLSFLLLGLLFLVDLLLQWRASVSTIILSLLLFFTSPAVLFFSLGYGQGVFFFLMALYIWLSEKVSVMRPVQQWGLGMSVLLAYLLLLPYWAAPFVLTVLFIWAVRVRGLERPIGRTWPMLLSMVGVFILASLFFQPVLLSPSGWDNVVIIVLGYVLLPFLLGWWFSKDSVWNWAGWIYIITWFVLSIAKGRGPSVYLIVPALCSWFLALGIGLDKALGHRLDFRRLFLTSMGVGLFLFLCWVLSDDLALRGSISPQFLLIKLEAISPDKIIVSKELQSLSVILPHKYRQKLLPISSVKWKRILSKEVVEKERILLLAPSMSSSWMEYVKKMGLSVEPIINFKLLDCSISHGIIPFLRDFEIYQLKVPDEDSCPCT